MPVGTQRSPGPAGVSVPLSGGRVLTAAQYHCEMSEEHSAGAWPARQGSADHGARLRPPGFTPHSQAARLQGERSSHVSLGSGFRPQTL